MLSKGKYWRARIQTQIGWISKSLFDNYATPPPDQQSKDQKPSITQRKSLRQSKGDESVEPGDSL